MEQQIQDLIASIRKDGIESATNESKKIIEEARKEADRIVRAAKEEKEKLLADGKKALETEKRSSEAALRQAARDASLTLKASIEAKFKTILSKKVSSAMDATLVASVLESVLKSEFAGKDVVVELPEADFAKVADQIAAAVADEMKEGITFRPTTSISGGFRVGEKDGDAYIDLSDEECTKLLYPYVSSTLKELL